MLSFPTLFTEAEQAVITHLNIGSTAFDNFAMIPQKYTCDGKNINPPLVVKHLPENTKSLALILEDPDAPIRTWVHWIVWNIPITGKIAENSIPGIEGINDFRQHSYGGPCPPSGKHRYIFRVYALDSRLNLPPDTTKRELEKAIKNHLLGYGELVGLYQKQ